MKGIRSIIFAFSIIATHSFAQQISVDLSYTYLYADQWDKAIQTYNFSRPDLLEKQPLLVHGIGASFSYLFPSNTGIKHGVGIEYCFAQSSVENPGFTNSLQLHTLHPRYIMQFAYSKTKPNLTSDLMFSTTLTGLLRSVNGEPFVVDEGRLNALGIGGSFHFKTAYSVNINAKYAIAPFINIGYSPYLFSPRAEAVINQTQGLASKPGTQLVSANIGVAFHFNSN